MESMKIVVLDRDGVINQDSDAFIKTPEEWTPIPGSLDAIARLCHHGWRVIVASNQSGIARQLFDLETLSAIHSKMCRLVADAGGHIDAVFFCPSVDNDHPDRKPNPGMLVDLAQRLQSPPESLIMIGDAARDIQAARAVGAKPILVRTGKGERTLQKWQGRMNFPVFADLGAAVDYLLFRHSEDEHKQQ